jgi:hypothetical protein
MTINDFLTEKINELKNDIIPSLKNEFSSHAFLQKFAKNYEEDYIDFLSANKRIGAFQNVHSQIARFLSDNTTVLNISKTERRESKNIFGEMDVIQWWEKE